MAYNVLTGEITYGLLYYVTGDQSVVYNEAIYDQGEYFRGNNIKTFTYSGAGLQELNEVTELKCAGIEFFEVSNDLPTFNETTRLVGFAIEFEPNDKEKIVNELTIIKGFALELIDYPFYSFEIIEKRL
ncbi:hypothetical protein [Mucilaginibacter phyllosphaerae]|uniref:Uncharacterized protein n=1 Tax=Mucilaginibacter phyllosphaerae TaxID=1812349 RepID=A0A4Y8AJM6_9SPHI|nr:hypothetical protein [Mucilaginibacter phyllosphaerae]MBB3967721.1 hypothetical protein [Mucilaginibacter phyllosphaerae]TEW69226.1 hypothetical protein E2R65_03395 [Mucilaginibacter phyllosphaerae]GGH03770.1 hypothetical protein GCM10007352_06580 [Mucilaginibacter phyllosphaerae]